MNIKIFIFLTIRLSACSSYQDKRLEYALELAEENRQELEKVLKHYQDSPEKLAAAHFLIQNIDLAFKVWKERPWNKNLCFEDFCELILPCRIANEKLSDWRYTYHNRYAPLLDSLYKGNDVIEACNTLMRILRTEGFYYNAQFKIPHLDALFLKENRSGYCRETCDIK